MRSPSSLTKLKFDSTAASELPLTAFVGRSEGSGYEVYQNERSTACARSSAFARRRETWEAPPNGLARILLLRHPYTKSYLKRGRKLSRFERHETGNPWMPNCKIPIRYFDERLFVAELLMALAAGLIVLATTLLLAPAAAAQAIGAGGCGQTGAMFVAGVESATVDDPRIWREGIPSGCRAT